MRPNCRSEICKVGPSNLSMTLLSLLFMGSMIACGPRPLTTQERISLEGYIPKQAQKLIAAKRLPNRAPMTNLELVRSIFSEQALLRERLPTPLTPGELKAISIRRPGHAQVGDLVYFKTLPSTLEYAVIYQVISHTRYRAIGILLGEVQSIEIDLATPQARRSGDKVINTIIRPITKRDSPPYLYLAGALFSEFRRLF